MIKIIVAIARGGVIGLNGAMPWHFSEDLRYFKRVTTGHAVVMGRRTFESLGRPLPARVNVVVTRNESWSAEGVEVVHSFDEAVRRFPDAFVIGGAEIYRQALPVAEELYITRIDAEYEGDTRFPEWDVAEWRLVSSERCELLDFQVYQRAAAASGD
ncbi:MAG: dihydrofolate reductase [Alistipes sp.]|jgi:dihydrofolate reductase|nr:dihydrofolate reductase [Alistipes sp.]